MKPDIFPAHKPLLSPPASNTKLRHSTTETHAAWSLSLSPGAKDVCPHASKGCLSACVGNGGMSKIFDQIGETRRLKAEFWRKQPERFYSRLISEILSVIEQHKTEEFTPLFRLNAFSDIPHEKHCAELFKIPGAHYYDYSKDLTRQTPENYRLTYSRSENNQEKILRLLKAGLNCSIVFHEDGQFAQHAAYAQRLPQTWHGSEVIDGDISDFRYLDPQADAPQQRGYVIGLRLKGGLQERRKAIETGFSVPYDWMNH